jgi:hypothetical protein
MVSRYLAMGAAVWTAANAGIYLAIIHGQAGSPAWWYVAILAAATAALALWAVSGRARALPLCAAAALGVLALLGILSVGLLLIPAVIAGAAAYARASQPAPGG